MKHRRRALDINPMAKIKFFAVTMVLVVLTILAVEKADARVDNLYLARIIVTGDGIERDTNIEPPRAQGRLRVEAGDDYVIDRMEWSAWYRGEDQPLTDDWVTVLDWVPNGSRYEVMSLQTNEQYDITFIRRAPPGEVYDPAIIFILTMEDGSTIMLDYRYE